jgi:hypothetical protein
MSTGSILVTSLIAIAVLWGVLEYRTLADRIKDNHITAVVRRAFLAQPGVFMLLGGAFCYWMGHLFWCACR